MRRRVTTPLGFPPCLHKDHVMEWEITRMCDLPLHIFMQLCGGIRVEKIS